MLCIIKSPQLRLAATESRCCSSTSTQVHLTYNTTYILDFIVHSYQYHVYFQSTINKIMDIKNMGFDHSAIISY